MLQVRQGLRQGSNFTGYFSGSSLWNGDVVGDAEGMELILPLRI